MTDPDRILVTPRSLTRHGLDDVATLEPLRLAGFELVGDPWRGRLPTHGELVEALPGAVGWLAGIEPIGADLLRHADRLRVISRNGAGTDTIDLAAATRADVRVVRAVGANARGVAELVVAMALCGLRDVVHGASELAQGRWTRRPGRELADATVGIVGFGAVGGRVAELFGALGSAVVAHDPHVDHAPVPLVPLDQVFARCDVISLNCPALPDGRPVVTAELLALVPPGTVLVNAARASLVDDQAVLAALGDGRLAAYAVDAHDPEPPPPSPLLRHDRVIATPHVGGATNASMRRAAQAAVANLLDALGPDDRRPAEAPTTVAQP